MSLFSDVRYAGRTLAKSPVFCSIAVLSLALGIGANAGVFTLLDQVMLHLLPVEQPQRLAQLVEHGDWYGSNNGMNAISYPMYEDLRKQNEVFSGMFCTYFTGFSASFEGRNERVAGELVSGTYFPVLGVRPALGRLFTPEDDRAPSGAPFAVLSYSYWQNRFGGDPSVVGKQILVRDHRLTIVGVAERKFEGVQALFQTQIFVPVAMAGEMTDKTKPLEDRRQRWVQVFGRMKPGVDLREAKASLAPLYHRTLEMEVQQKEFAHTTPYTRQQFLKGTLDAAPGGRGQDVVRQFLEAPLWAMMAMVALVLLIACANVANLMIARASARQKEIAVRLALGAGRARIVRQLLVEGLLLALAGGLVGLIISPWAMRLLISIMPETDPPLRFALDPNLRLVLFTMAVSVVSAVIFGLAPAVQAARPNIAPVLKDQAGAVVGGGQARWRKMLVVAQVSLSLLLLIGAGLFGRSLHNLKSVNPGFDVNNLLSFQVDPTLNGYNPERAKLLYRQLQDSLAALPSTSSAALCVVPPLTFDEWDSSVTVEGYVAKPGEDMNPRVNYVSPGYFATLKIPVYQGRDFTEQDALKAPKVAIVNEKFAKHYFGGGDALGRHIGLGGDPGTKTDIEIVAVVHDTRYSRMNEELQRQVYFPYLQNDLAWQMTAYVRTPLRPEQMFPMIRAAVRKLDANLPLSQMKTEEKQRDDSLSVERLSAALSSAFGVLATVLAAIGIYGVMAFLVARRTREIGIRMALGASAGTVVWLVMREVLLLAAAGVLIGLPIALAVTRLIESQLYGIGSHDPGIAIAATLGLVAVATLSGYLPARRATRVDPATALRYE
ncbi:MAG: ABC transporter permease [Bryobacteraceae bacterium]